MVVYRDDSISPPSHPKDEDPEAFVDTILEISKDPTVDILQLTVDHLI